MNEIIEIDWVRHARSCSNDGSLLEKIMQPPITYLGILQSFKLSTNVFDKNFNYNEIYSSASVRTIMTALFALREQNYSLLKTTGKKLKIIIVPYINEDTNPAAYVGAIDNQNIILNTEQISNVINYFKIIIDQFITIVRFNIINFCISSNFGIRWFQYILFIF